MKKIIQLSLAFLAVKYLMACTPVQFSHDISADASAGAVSCSGSQCVQSHTDTQTVGLGKSDILFVVDNSGSMSDVMAKVAARFSTFFSLIQNQNYQIAITTTDVASQGGQFLTFSDGSKVLTPSSSNVVSQFNTAITQQQTLNCAANSYQAGCASTYPRAIYATNLALQAEPSFFRTGVPLSLIVVSDADEDDGPSIQASLNPLVSADYPSTLIAAIDPSISFTANAIVIEPGDTGCYNSRYGRNGNPYLFGFYGTIYSQLVSATGGSLGSVCAADYGSQLQSIASTINTVTSMGLSCAPVNNAYTVTFSPAAPSITYSLSGQKVNFSQAVPTGTTITIQYECGV